MSILPLTDDQKQKLIDLSQKAPDLLLHRARLILAYSAGKPTMQAAADAGMSRGRARYWKRQFIAEGMSIFTRNPVIERETRRPQKSADTLPEDAIPSKTGKSSSDVAIEIPFPEPRSSIGISPDDTLADAGRKVWLYHFALMLSHEKGTLLGEDIEELHDMRVATRRMRTAFDVFGAAFDQKLMRHYLKSLRAIGRVLGAVRDMDVILQHARDYQHNEETKTHDLEPLLIAWMNVINKKRTKLIRRLQSEDYQAFIHSFNQFLQANRQIKPGIDSGGINSHLRDIVPMLVYGRYAAVRSYESILPFASVNQLHALRIECKKFRYVLEYFREILGDNIGQAITELKQLQDHLGELHDTDVASQLVTDFLESWEEEQLSMPIAERKNPEPIVRYLAYLHAERYHLISTFPELWKKFSRPEFRQGIAQAISLL